MKYLAANCAATFTYIVHFGTKTYLIWKRMLQNDLSLLCRCWVTVVYVLGKYLLFFLHPKWYTSVYCMTFGGGKGI
jgi:hypothetical protein